MASDTKHNRVVKQILDVDAAARRYGFRRSLIAVFARNDDECDCDKEDCAGGCMPLADRVASWRHEFARLNVIPDAYRIDEVAQRVTVFEVCHTHPLGWFQSDTYADLWWMLDFYGWSLELVVVAIDGGYSHVNMLSVGLEHIWHHGASAHKWPVSRETLPDLPLVPGTAGTLSDAPIPSLDFAWSTGP